MLPIRPYLPSAFTKLKNDKSDTTLNSDAAVRAYARIGTHRDDKHHSLSGGGLHTSYVDLYEDTKPRQPGEKDSHADIVWKTFDDTLDVITTLDRIDAGFSLFLHIPGFLAPGTPISMDNISINAYLPPREVEHHRTKLERPIADIVQIFAEQVAVPHLKWTQDYRKSSGLPPLPQETTRARRLHPNERSRLATMLLPPPTGRGSSHFQFACRAPGIDLGTLQKAGQPETVVETNTKNSKGHASDESAPPSDAELAFSKMGTSTRHDTEHMRRRRSGSLPSRIIGSKPGPKTTGGELVPPGQLVNGKLATTLPSIFSTRPELLSALPASLSDSSGITTADRELPVLAPMKGINPQATGRFGFPEVSTRVKRLMVKYSLGPEWAQPLHDLAANVDSSQWVQVMERAWGFNRTTALNVATALFLDSSSEEMEEMDNQEQSPASTVKARSRCLEYSAFVMSLTCFVVLLALFLAA